MTLKDPRIPGEDLGEGAEEFLDEVLLGWCVKGLQLRVSDDEHP
ncbi:hypothetical protein [Myxococcus sp. AM009]|nr:hypothetical protein [Myxococcus sp. AM009]